MTFFEHRFLGVKTDDMKSARKACEALIGAPMKMTHSTFYGGDHCHVALDDSGFDLRLNHHDDGDGWSWCIEDPRYPLVLDCHFRTLEAKQRILTRLDQFPIFELDPRDR
jgi:hypothetical protein